MPSSIIVIDEKDLAERSQNADLVGRVHRWTVDERMSLCILHKWHSNHGTEIATVFNKFHGLDVGYRAVAAQIRDMHRKCNTISKECREILSHTSFSNPPQNIERFCERLRKVADRFGITLRRRTQGNAISPKSTSRKRPASESDTPDDEEDNYSTFSDEEPVIQRSAITPSIRRGAQPVSQRTHDLLAVTHRVQQLAGELVQIWLTMSAS